MRNQNTNKQIIFFIIIIIIIIIIITIIISLSLSPSLPHSHSLYFSLTLSLSLSLSHVFLHRSILLSYYHHSIIYFTILFFNGAQFVSPLVSRDVNKTCFPIFSNVNPYFGFISHYSHICSLYWDYMCLLHIEMLVYLYIGYTFTFATFKHMWNYLSAQSCICIYTDIPNH